MNKAIIIGCVIVFLLSMGVSLSHAPYVNSYDDYHIDTYNCLHIAQDCHTWHEANGINTTVMIGLFNNSMGHAWLIDTDTQENIIGHVPTFEYTAIMTFEEFETRYEP